MEESSPLRGARRWCPHTPLRSSHRAIRLHVKAAHKNSTFSSGGGKTLQGSPASAASWLQRGVSKPARLGIGLLARSGRRSKRRWPGGPGSRPGPGWGMPSLSSLYLFFPPPSPPHPLPSLCQSPTKHQEGRCKEATRVAVRTMLTPIREAIMASTNLARRASTPQCQRRGHHLGLQPQ